MADPRAADLRAIAPQIDAVCERSFQAAKTALLPGDVSPIGLQASLAVRGELVTTFCLGVDGLGEPITPTTMFGVASQSKPVLSLLALRLVAAGLLDLDAPIWPKLDTWVPPPEHAPVEWRDRVTARHLLAHKAGFDMALFPPAERDKLHPPVELLSGVTRLIPHMSAAPDARVEYSSVGYVIAGLAIESLHNRPLQSLAKEHLFDPLSMSACFGPPDHPIARGLLLDGSPSAEAYFPGLGGSGIHATAPDLARLLSIAAADAHVAGPGFFDHGLLDRALHSDCPPKVQPRFASGFVLIDWPPFSVFQHIGFGVGVTGITKAMRELGAAVSVQVVAPREGGQATCNRVARSMLRIFAAALGTPVLAIGAA